MAIARQRAPESESEITGRAMSRRLLCLHSDPYGEDVLYSGYSSPKLLDPNEYRHQLPAMFISSLAQLHFPQQLITPDLTGA